MEELDSTVVDKIVEYGTAPEATVNINSSIASVKKNTDGSGTLTLADGSTLSFSGVKSMTATAYTAGHGGADYTTATGTLVRVGTVAVDKSVIPLGTRMYIVSNDGSVVYGLAVAEDTGVRGNIVDLVLQHLWRSASTSGGGVAPSISWSNPPAKSPPAQTVPGDLSAFDASCASQFLQQRSSSASVRII